MSDSALIELARSAGLAPEWIDAAGHAKTVPVQTLRIVLQALGLQSDSDVDIAESRQRLTERHRKPPAMLVAQAGARIGLGHVRSAILHFDDGKTVQADLVPGDQGQSFFDAPTQTGYHTIELDGEMRTLAVTPLRCFTVEDVAPGRHLSALAVQMYGLRGGHSAGFGDLAALADIATQAASHGIDAVAVSPLHTLMPGAISPYGPSTRYFYNALYADAALAGGPVGTDDGAAFVNWPDASRQKLSDLEQAFHAFRKAGPQDDFKTFCSEGGVRLTAHVRFEVLDAHFRTQGIARWREWPKEFQDPASPQVAAFAREHADVIAFRVFLQWLTARSLENAQAQSLAAGMKVGLISDIAVGMDPDGSHAWSAPQEILSGLSVGAPPDIFNTQGQNWGLTALSPAGFREEGYGAFIDTLRAAMRYAGGVRIDHAMGLFRLWLVPQGAGSHEGVYLHYPMDDLVNLIALESHRQRAIVIGEDLGTLPDGFRPAMGLAGIMGMEVLWFQREGRDFLPPQRWSKAGAALTTTHDLPTVAGWWKGRDIDWLEKLGRKSEHGDAAAERQARAEDRTKLWAAYQQAGSAAVHEPPAADPAPAVVAALDFVGRTPCDLAIVPIEDILDVAEQPNIPGTIDEHPNWRRRLPAGDAFASPQAQTNLAKLHRARSQS